MKTLIVDYLPFEIKPEQINESMKENSGKLIVKGVLQRAEAKNQNGRIATVRSGNCIGGGDWTKDRIVKDCAELFIFDKNLTIRSPKATRPWQHVLEPLSGYLLLAEALFTNPSPPCEAFNFGPCLASNRPQQWLLLSNHASCTVLSRPSILLECLTKSCPNVSPWRVTMWVSRQTPSSH